ncbi:MAG: hypothetical protein AAGD05_19590, partial [Bacteroidota bacterium]
VDPIVEQFSAAGYWPVALSLGSFDVVALAPFLQSSVLATQSQVIHLDAQGQVQTFEATSTPSPEAIALGGDALSSLLLPAYAVAFNGLMELAPPLQTPWMETHQAEPFHAQLYKKARLGIVVGFLILLLANTFAYYQFKDQNRALQTGLFYKRSQLSELDSLRQHLEQQQRFMQESQLNQYSKASYYADQIGASLPEGIQLTALEIYPAKVKTRQEKETDWTQYAANQIKVKGQCKSSLQYNEWINRLTAFDWVQSVNHLNYRDLSQDLGSFESLINLSPSKKSAGAR